MDYVTAQALEKSIAHWEANLAAAQDNEMDMVYVGAAGCALCQLFNAPDMTREERCVECPVYGKTGQPNCGDTPYRLVVYNLDRALENVDGAAAETVKSIQEELDFLKSLRV